MKKSIGILVVMSLLAGALVVQVHAFPPDTWVSGVTVANMTGEQALVNIQFYNQDGSPALNFDGGSISANSAKTWYLPSHVTGLADGFIGSAVVSSNKEIAATVNTQRPTDASVARVGTSQGVRAPVQTAYATQLPKDYYGWNSYCAVQNTGSDAVDVTATFYASSGSKADTDTRAIEAYSSYIFDLEENGALSGDIYSAKFEGDPDHPLAVVCNFYNDAEDASQSQFHSYNGLGAGGDKVYLPRVVKDFYNYQSGLRIQNIGDEALRVAVTYNFGGTEYTQQSPLIGVGQSWGPYLGDESQLPSSMSGVSGSGSAEVEIVDDNANKTIIATVNEDNRVDPAGRGVTYLGALPSDATDSLVFPQVTAEFYGYSSGLQVMKTTAGKVNCTANYSDHASVSAFTEDFTLTDSRPKWDQFAPNASGMSTGYDDYNGSVTINCTGGNVVGITNLSYRYDVDPRYGTKTGDSFTTVRGINK